MRGHVFQSWALLCKIGHSGAIREKEIAFHVYLTLTYGRDKSKGVIGVGKNHLLELMGVDEREKPQLLMSAATCRQIY